jgi:glycosyltransferase involved in cell wall biosynthesis
MTESVSVVVPTLDRPGPLARAVSAILDQDYPGSVECIVVFDRAEPGPVDIPADLPPNRTVRVLTNARTPGLAGGRNTGIEAATGELVAFCDDDDLWRPTKLRRQTAVLAGDPDLALVGCGIVLRHGDKLIAKPLPMTTVTLDDLLVSRVAEAHPSGFLARRSAILDTIGLVDEEIPGSYAEDYDWLLRAAKHHPIILVDEPLVEVTWQSGSLFARRWQTIVDALTYLLVKHPELAASSFGRARISGQIAFAHAAMHHRHEARRWARRALRDDRHERRAYLALAASFGLLPINLALRAAHARGKGL